MHINGHGFAVTAGPLIHKKSRRLSLAACFNEQQHDAIVHAATYIGAIRSLPARPRFAQDQLALPRSGLALIDMWEKLRNMSCLVNSEGSHGPHITILE